MSNMATVFFLGPFHFLIQLFKFVLYGQMEVGMFVVSGVGTAFWAGVIEAVAGGDT